MSDSSDPDSEIDGGPSPLLNPPPSHKLQTHKYDSFDDLIDDLHEYTAQAGFSIRILRLSNKHKDLGYTRYDIACSLDKIRPSKEHSRTASTAKRDCA